MQAQLKFTSGYIETRWMPNGLERPMVRLVKLDKQYQGHAIWALDTEYDQTYKAAIPFKLLYTMKAKAAPDVSMAVYEEIGDCEDSYKYRQWVNIWGDTGVVANMIAVEKADRQIAWNQSQIAQMDNQLAAIDKQQQFVLQQKLAKPSHWQEMLQSQIQQKAIKSDPFAAALATAKQLPYGEKDGWLTAKIPHPAPPVVIEEQAVEVPEALAPKKRRFMKE